MNDLTPQQHFEQKIEEKLRKDIGDMLPDEMLTALIERAVNKMFFEPRKKMVGDSYRQREVITESYFEEQVMEYTKERITRIVHEWLSDNKDMIFKRVDETLSKGAEDLILGAIVNTFRDSMQTMTYNVRNDLEARLNSL